MVKKFSNQKVSKIIGLNFHGYTQTAIANKLKVNQSSVSIQVANFKSLVEQQGLAAAAKEYGVMDQVEELFGLAAELKKAKLTAEEAKAGLKMALLFQEYGVEEDEYGKLIEACQKAKDQGYLTAALDLKYLEDGTGMTYQEVVEEFKSVSQKLPQAKNELEKVSGEIDARNTELAGISEQKKVATQDLKIEMQEIGVDKHRMELVETLAKTLKKAGVPDKELENYIQRQELFNQAAISENLFSKILEKAKVATSADNGQQLLKMLTESSGLTEAINKQQVKKDFLANEVNDLEKQAKLKGQLEGEVAKLKADKASLEAHLTELERQGKALDISLHGKEAELAQLSGDVGSAQTYYGELTQKSTEIEQDIKEKQTTVSALEEDIRLREEKVSDLKEQEAKHAQLETENIELSARMSRNKHRLEMLYGFIGFLQASSMEELKKKVHILTELVAAAEGDKFSPALLKNYVLKDLVGHELQILKCHTCQAQFIVDKSAPSSDYKCPLETVFHHSVTVEKDADKILKEAMALPETVTISGLVIKLVKIPPAQKDKKPEL